MKNFKQEQSKNIKTLEQYVPVVSKVHGGNHPEFHEVHKLFEEINNKMKTKEFDDMNLNTEFEQLRKVTSGYRIPSDTCETFEAVYNILSDLDESYNRHLDE